MPLSVNGVEWSRADLDGLWWSFAEMLAYASEAAPVKGFTDPIRFWRLRPAAASATAA